MDKVPNTKFVVAVWIENGEETTDVVPTNWLEEDDGSIFLRWPTKKKLNPLGFLKSRPTPMDSWSRHIIIKIGKGSDDYNKCSTYLSGLESESDDVFDAKRKRIPNKRFIETEPETQTDEAAAKDKNRDLSQGEDKENRDRYPRIERPVSVLNQPFSGGNHNSSPQTGSDSTSSSENEEVEEDRNPVKRKLSMEKKKVAQPSPKRTKITSPESSTSRTPNFSTPTGHQGGACAVTNPASRNTPLSTHQTPRPSSTQKEIEKFANMSEAEYRWMVCYNLSQIKQRIKRVEQTMEAQRTEPHPVQEGGEAIVTPRQLLPVGGLSTQEELDRMVENIQSAPSNRDILVEILGRSARKGAEPKEAVYAVLRKLFDWSLTRNYNVRGTAMKKSIYDHPLFSIIVDAIKVQSPTITDKDLREHLKNYLKNCGTNFKRREGGKGHDDN